LIYLPFIAGNITLQKFLIIQAGALGAALVAAILVILTAIGFQKQPKKTIDLKAFRSVIPFSVLVFLMAVHNRADAFLLERLHPDGAYEAGIYAAAYRLLDAALMPGNLLIAFLLPYMARRFANQLSLTEVVLNTRHFLLILAIGVSVFCFFMAPWLQALLYKHPVTYSAEVLQLTIAAMIGFTLVQVYGTVLTATGAVSFFARIILCSVVLNVGLNLLLISHLGARASPVAAIVSQYGCGVYLFFYVHRKFKIPMHMRSIKYYGLAAICCIALLLLGRQYHISPWVLMPAYLVMGLMLLYLLLKPVILKPAAPLN
jgi:O-antigen/teichoic acid export membrane protein